MCLDAKLTKRDFTQNHNKLIKQFRNVRVIKPDLHGYVMTTGLTD